MFRIMAIVVGATVTFMLGSTALAAPDNKNTESFPVDCDGLGAFQVTENIRGGENSGGVVFGPDGQVLVAKGFSDASFEGSIEIEGGPTITFPPEPFDEEPKGKGYEDRLIECDFTQTFSETFELTAEDIEFLEAHLAEQGTPMELDAFLGAEATFTGAASGTAHVLVVGRR